MADIFGIFFQPPQIHRPKTAAYLSGPRTARCARRFSPAHGAFARNTTQAALKKNSVTKWWWRSSGGFVSRFQTKTSKIQRFTVVSMFQNNLEKSNKTVLDRFGVGWAAAASHGTSKFAPGDRRNSRPLARSVRPCRLAVALKT